MRDFFFRELVPCKLFQGKKKNSVFYFFRICGKKKTQIEKIELVSNPQTFPGKKKNTIPLPQLVQIFKPTGNLSGQFCIHF